MSNSFRNDPEADYVYDFRPARRGSRRTRQSRQQLRVQDPQAQDTELMCPDAVVIRSSMSNVNTVDRILGR